VDAGVAVGVISVVGVWVGVVMTLGQGVGVGVEDLLSNPSVITVMLIAITSTKAINAIFTVFFI
jgi:hypothetical protein